MKADTATTSLKVILCISTILSVSSGDWASACISFGIGLFYSAAPLVTHKPLTLSAALNAQRFYVLVLLPARCTLVLLGLLPFNETTWAASVTMTHTMMMLVLCESIAERAAHAIWIAAVFSVFHQLWIAVLFNVTSLLIHVALVHWAAQSDANTQIAVIFGLLPTLPLLLINAGSIFPSVHFSTVLVMMCGLAACCVWWHQKLIDAMLFEALVGGDDTETKGDKALRLQAKVTSVTHLAKAWSFVQICHSIYIGNWVNSCFPFSTALFLTATPILTQKPLTYNMLLAYLRFIMFVTVPVRVCLIPAREDLWIAVVSGPVAVLLLCDSLAEHAASALWFSAWFSTGRSGLPHIQIAAPLISITCFIFCVLLFTSENKWRKERNMVCLMIAGAPFITLPYVPFGPMSKVITSSTQLHRPL